MWVVFLYIRNLYILSQDSQLSNILEISHVPECQVLPPFQNKAAQKLSSLFLKKEGSVKNHKDTTLELVLC
jgi:hypothetical protein